MSIKGASSFRFSIFFFVFSVTVMLAERMYSLLSFNLKNLETPIFNVFLRLTSVTRFCEMLKATTLKVG